MIEALQIIWAIVKLGRRVYKTYFDNDPVSSAYKANVLKQAMEAVDEGDVLKLNSALLYFDRLSKSRFPPE